MSIPRTSQTFVGVRRGRAWHSTVYSLPYLASVAPRWRPDVSGALRSPPNTPVVREAPQATRSLTGEKRDLEPSESVHLELRLQACGTVVSLSGMSAFRRCALHASQMTTLGVERDNKICAV